jgi:hypothetical protein
MNYLKRLFRSVLPLIFFAITVLDVFPQLNPIKPDSVLNARLDALEKAVADKKSGESSLVVVGLTTFGYVGSRTVNTFGGINQTTRSSGFGNGDTYEFSPMFLFRHGQNLLLEFEPSFNNDGLSVNWANISYFLAPNVIVRGGYFVLPFGMYSKKLAAAWINKLATDPMGLPTSADYGIGISGGLPLGPIKWNYDVSLTNGFYLLSNGQFQSDNLSTNGRNKTFCGRVGLLPFSNNSMEIGFSALTGGLANGNAQFQNSRINMFALDLNYVKNINPFQINIKSQYNVVNITNQNFVNSLDTTQLYSFHNQTISGYEQISLRMVGAQNPIIKKLELAFRYGIYNTPTNSSYGDNNSQVDYGINYWINWRTVVRGTYEIITTNNTSNNNVISGLPDKSKYYAYHLQFSVQF